MSQVGYVPYILFPGQSVFKPVSHLAYVRNTLRPEQPMPRVEYVPDIVCPVRNSNQVRSDTKQKRHHLLTIYISNRTLIGTL